MNTVSRVKVCVFVWFAIFIVILSVSELSKAAELNDRLVRLALDDEGGFFGMEIVSVWGCKKKFIIKKA